MVTGESTQLERFYRGKRVFVTGHTGFKGSWLSLWLSQLGATVYGYSSEPPSDPHLFDAIKGAEIVGENGTGDVRDYERLREAIARASPDLVFHLAAQPLVRRSYRHPRETFEVNVMGTVNLLDAVRALDSVRACLVVTSDKCYENREWVFSYRECDRLGGHDPYSASKAFAELVLASYRKSFFANVTESGHRDCALATARAGNVLGGGDWAEDRIVADCLRSLQSGSPIRVRNPTAIRPWQHVLEPLSGYLWLASRMVSDPGRFSGAWNFGPRGHEQFTVQALVETIVKLWQSGEWMHAASPGTAHEAGLLRLSIEKAQAELGWNPTWDFHATVARTVSWFQQFSHRPDRNTAYQACLSDIRAFVDCARTQESIWAA